jgi:hypothetical protein
MPKVWKGRLHTQKQGVGRAFVGRSFAEADPEVENDTIRTHMLAMLYAC